MWLMAIVARIIVAREPVMCIDAPLVRVGKLANFHILFQKVSWRQPLQDHRPKLISQLSPDFNYFSCFPIIPQGSGHFLVGHDLTVSLALPPELCQSFLVFGDKLEDPIGLVDPLNAVSHVWVMKRFMKIFKKAQFFSACQETNKSAHTFILKSIYV